MNPQIQELENLLDAILAGVQEVLQSGEVLSSELQNLIADEITFLTDEIDTLYLEQSNITPPTTPPQPNLEQAMPSSNIESFGYDDKTGRLLVRFLGEYPNRNGPIYGYEGVPKQIFELFRNGAVPARTDGRNRWGRWWKGKVPSMGASMFTLIKNGGYPYQRLS